MGRGSRACGGSRSPTFSRWVSGAVATTPIFGTQLLADLALLPVRVDPDTDRQAWGATAQLAARQRLTLYDAAYLELARRRGLPLATLDRELRTAASDEGVALLGK